jgi:hypothetical protein
VHFTPPALDFGLEHAYYLALEVLPALQASETTFRVRKAR